MWNSLVEGMILILNFFFTISHSYGIAIILLTIFVKILLYPLSHYQFKAMIEMQKLQPHLKKIQEKYKKNPKEMQRRMMDLYREHKINPLSGCLPLIVQMPILIILYKAVMSIKTEFINGCFLWGQNTNNPDLLLFTDTQFLWIPSLLIPDFPLLILYTLSMYVSQRLTIMPTVDKAQLEQQKMMAWMMPLLFLVMFRSFPSAFILYWFIFNILSTAQQIFVMRKFKHLIVIPQEKEEKK
jgi:YidC/Oxa1 family membrane protein insertase